MAVSTRAHVALAVVAVLVLGAASWALAQPWGPPADRLTLAWPRLRQALNLTDEQARRLDQVLQAHRARVARLRLDLARARLDLREVMQADRPDPARVEEIASRIGTLTGELVRARVALETELRAILTPEQYIKLRAFLRHRARPRR